MASLDSRVDRLMLYRSAVRKQLGFDPKQMSPACELQYEQVVATYVHCLVTDDLIDAVDRQGPA